MLVKSYGLKGVLLWVKPITSVPVPRFCCIILMGYLPSSNYTLVIECNYTLVIECNYTLVIECNYTFVMQCNIVHSLI